MLDSEDHPPSEISVLLADSQEMREMNLRHRFLDEPTDVLSFPAGPGPEMLPRTMLGDIAICLPVAEAQAAQRGTPLETELACLAVHGGLHLLGYDDDTEPQRDEMIAKMNAIICAIGLLPAENWHSSYLHDA
jgi:probable rRNA maturation factor